jgi:hypothetical protein
MFRQGGTYSFRRFPNGSSVRHYPCFCLPKTRKNSNFNGNQAMRKRSKKSLAERIKLIRSARGMFKLKPGEKSVVEELLEERRAERERENRN